MQNKKDEYLVREGVKDSYTSKDRFYQSILYRFCSRQWPKQRKTGRQWLSFCLSWNRLRPSVCQIFPNQRSCSNVMANRKVLQFKLHLRNYF